MNRESVLAFLQSIGVKKDNITINGDWINCSCPLARWNHQKKKDEKPSFGAVVTTDGTAIYRCFSCTPKAEPLENILDIIKKRTGKYPRESAKILIDDKASSKQELVTPIVSLPDTGKAVKPYRKVAKSVLREHFPLLCESNTKRAKKLREYLYERIVSDEAMEHFGVRYWSTGPTGYLAFPMTLRNGDITNLSIRYVKTKKNFYLTGKMHNSPTVKYMGSRETGAWFGLANVTRPHSDLIVCEGPIDALCLYTLGVRNPIASGGTSITDKQIYRIPGVHVMVGMDADEAGYKAAMYLYNRMKDTHVLSFLDWGVANAKDPGELYMPEELSKVLFAKTSRPQRISEIC